MIRLAVRLVPVEEKETLREMLLPHFAEIAPELADPLGRFFSAYWSDAERFPFWIECCGERVGFGLVRACSAGHELAEFGIVDAWRRKRVGARAACLLFARFPGRWELGVARHSPGGLAFWQHVLKGCDGVTEIKVDPPRLPLQCANLTFEMRGTT